MSYDLPTGDEAIKALKREIEILRDSIPVNTFFLGQEQGHTALGGLSELGGKTSNVTAYHPLIAMLGAGDLTDKQLQVSSTTIIVDGDGDDLELQTLVGTQYDGQFLLIKPKEGKTLSIIAPSGSNPVLGNIDITSTITLSDTQFTILQYHYDALADNTTGNEDNVGRYLVLNASGTWNGTASSDLDMSTFNITGLDQLIFSTAGSTSDPTWDNANYGIEADTNIGLHYQIPTGKFHNFSVNGTQEFAISAGIIDAKSKRIQNVTDPTADQDVVTKAWHNANLGSSGVALTDDPVWTGKHVWDNGDTWSNDYDTNAEKSLHCHAKFQGDGDEHTGHDQYARQRVLEIGKYGTHELKLIAEVVGAVDEDLSPDAFMITDPSYSGTDPENNTYAIPSSSPAISFKSNLVMNTYNIYDLDQLVFGQSTSTLSPPWENDHLGIEVYRESNGETLGLGYNVEYGLEHTFKVGYGTAGSQNQSNDIVYIGASGNSQGSGGYLRMVNAGSSITLQNNSFIHAYNSAEIGFHVTQNTTVGSQGTIEIPYLVDTTEYSEADTSALNTAFGDDNGSVGVQHDTDGTDVLWFRANDVWRKAGGTAGSHSHSGGNITSGTVDAARLGSGSSITSKFLRGDNTWQTVSGGGSYDPASSDHVIPSGNETKELGASNKKWLRLWVDELLTDSVNGSLTPTSDSNFDLGSGSRYWRYCWLKYPNLGEDSNNLVSIHGIIGFQNNTSTSTSNGTPTGKITVLTPAGTKYLYYYNS